MARSVPFHLDAPGAAHDGAGPVRPARPSASELVAGVRRHPSSQVARPHRSCSRCGFRAPSRDDAAGALDRLPRVWADALLERSSPDRLRGALRVRDELHAATNRISQILLAPGSSVLASVPTSEHEPRHPGPLHPRHVVMLLLLAVQRAGEILRTLHPEDWSATGRLGDGAVTVEDLVAMPLHRSHARLTQGGVCR